MHASRLTTSPLRTCFSVLVAALVLSCLLGARTADAAPLQQLQGTLTTSTTDYVVKSSPSDPRYWSQGKVYGLPAECPTCESGVALGSLVLAREGVSTSFDSIAVATQTFDRLISKYRRADGAFAVANDGSPDITTVFLGNDLGMALVLGDGVLPAATKQRWRPAVTGAADFLIRNGNLRWYTNGNITLANAALMWLAYETSGDAKYRTAYDTALDFALSPPQARWPGFGLRVTRQGSAADGSDSSGYLAESGGGTPGFDAEYSGVTLDVASRLYLVSRDARVKKLANMIMNQLMPRVTTSWWLDTSGGTRHTEAQRQVPFMSAGPSVLATAAGRSDLTAGLDGQVAQIATTMQDGMRYANPDYYKALGVEARRRGRRPRRRPRDVHPATRPRRSPSPPRRSGSHRRPRPRPPPDRLRPPPRPRRLRDRRRRRRRRRSGARPSAPRRAGGRARRGRRAPAGSPPRPLAPAVAPLR